MAILFAEAGGVCRDDETGAVYSCADIEVLDADAGFPFYDEDGIASLVCAVNVTEGWLDVWDRLRPDPTGSFFQRRRLTDRNILIRPKYDAKVLWVEPPVIFAGTIDPSIVRNSRKPL